jgi:DNA-directed RNA polymerase subunit F
MFFIRVQTDSEYKYIREDRWNTPVRTNLQSDAKLFDTAKDALEYAERFMLVGTHYVHEIVETQEIVKFTCHYAPNSTGKWVLDAKAVK